MNIYKGVRVGEVTDITVNGRPLLLNITVEILGDDRKYDWGYSGRYCARTALAILAHELNCDEAALAAYEGFLMKVVAHLPHDDWELTSDDIKRALADIPHAAA